MAAWESAASAIVDREKLILAAQAAAHSAHASISLQQIKAAFAKATDSVRTKVGGGREIPSMTRTAAGY